MARESSERLGRLTILAVLRGNLPPDRLQVARRCGRGRGDVADQGACPLDQGCPAFVSGLPDVAVIVVRVTVRKDERAGETGELEAVGRRRAVAGIEAIDAAVRTRLGARRLRAGV